MSEWESTKRENFVRLKEIISQYMMEFEIVYRNNLISHNRQATGNLINSIKTTVKSEDDSYFEVELQVADYWMYVENGRRAGKQPPKDAILNWIRVKPILPRPDSKGRLPTENQLAYLIGRKIAKYGTTGTHDIQMTIDQLNEKYINLMQKSIEEEWYDFQLDILNDINLIRI